ncbi:unnamed protein product [Owenia fusiformis]|uniref:non-specific serine/threonine protein kinase n=1 Tax=Owenia fusiformis TaxID=6347 RepID=A0A8J1TZ69_OWEFU|nr:unnamed protein product [Owenia fusiformis]
MDENHKETLAKLRGAVTKGDKHKLLEVLNEHKTHARIDDLLNPLKTGYYPFHEACKLGHEDVVILLMGYWDDIDMEKEGEGSPLKLAAANGHVEITDILLSQGAYVAEPSKDLDSPFYVATLFGHAHVLDILMDHAASLISTIENLKVLLYAACMSGLESMVNRWLNPQIDINDPIPYLLPSLPIELQEAVPLYAACKSNSIDVVKLLLYHGADITTAVIEKYPDIFSQIFDEEVTEHWKANNDGTTELHHRVSLTYNCLHGVHPTWLTRWSDTLTHLDLSHNSITTLPSAVPWELNRLQVMDVSFNRIEVCSVPDTIHCHCLADVKLNNNKFRTLPSKLFQIMALETLDASSNVLESLITNTSTDSDMELLDTFRQEGSRHARVSKGVLDQIWYASKLHTINLSKNNLRDLPAHIALLEGVCNLDLSENKFCKLPKPWDCRLLQLNLSNNFLDEFILEPEDKWSSSIRKLDIHGNRFQDIPPGVCGIVSLVDLNISHNNLKCLPMPESWRCKKLRHLNLSNNQLCNVSIPPPSKSPMTPFSKVKGFFQTAKPAIITEDEDLLVLPKFEDLHLLNLSNNHLLQVPPSICKLKYLETLNIKGNPHITELPKGLGNLKIYCHIKFDEGQATNIPKQLLQGNEMNRHRDILAFLCTQLRQSVPHHSMKLMVVGKEKRGKTSLLAALQGKPSPIYNVATNGIVVEEWKLLATQAKKSQKSKDLANLPDITFSTWDLAGQEEFYVTHQCFLSSNALYIAVWDLRLKDAGIDNLVPWLLNIQSRAPDSSVFIVGTYLDCIPPKEMPSLTKKIQARLKREFVKSGYPIMVGFQAVSCNPKCYKGIDELKEKIYDVACAMTNKNHSSEPLIGRQVPKSYLKLRDTVLSESSRRIHNEEPPVLNEEEFKALAHNTPGNDINSHEELMLAARFLHENGVLLHFNEELRGLNSLFFIDPCWFAEMLAKIITIDGVHTFVQGGILKKSDAAQHLFKDGRFPAKLLPQYVQLMERFDIALQLDADSLLIPSKLGGKPSIGSMSSVSDQEEKLLRIYKMAYIPSGFWSRLVTRLLFWVKNSKKFSKQSTFKKRSSTEKMKHLGLSKSWNQTLCRKPSDNRGFYLRQRTYTFWDKGLRVSHKDGYFTVEDLHCCPGDDINGIKITVSTNCDDFSPMGMIVDHIDTLIKEWYPGLDVRDCSGQMLVEKLVPCYMCTKLHPEWKLHQVELLDFTMCVLVLLEYDHMYCRMHPDTPVPLRHLIPDVMLHDLPKKFLLDVDKLDYRATDETCLGEGGEGGVYKGTYDKVTVAVKQYHSSNINSKLLDIIPQDYLQPSSDKSHKSVDSGRGSIDENAFESIENQLHMAKVIKCFNDLRQEVSLLGQLHHPCIVALVGVCIRPLCFALELAPLGSLRGILDKELNMLDTMKQLDNQREIIFNRTLTYKLILQLTSGLVYLHSQNVIYRDLKSDNILVCSLDENATVNVKISDYGISCFNTLQGVRGAEGTTGYQAPEVQPGMTYDSQVDIYSLGMVMYESLTGYRPYHNLDNVVEIRKATRDRARPSLQRDKVISSWVGLERLMEQCWSHDPEMRPSANDVYQTMRVPSFLCQTNVLPSAGVFSKVTCIYVPHMSQRQQVVLMWSGSEEMRTVYSVNLAQNNRVDQHTHPGAEAQCCHRVNNYIWLGTERCQIEILTILKDGSLKCAYEPLPVPSIPLDILHKETMDNDDRDKVFVSGADGTISIFIPSSQPVISHNVTLSQDIKHRKSRESTVIEGASRQLPKWRLFTTKNLCVELDVPHKSVKCMQLVENGSKLWVSFGGSVVVLDSDSLEHQATIDVSYKGTHIISQFLTYNGSVFCVCRRMKDIVQCQIDSCQAVCRFQCQDAHKGKVIAVPINTQNQQTSDISSPESQPDPNDGNHGDKSKASGYYTDTDSSNDDDFDSYDFITNASDEESFETYSRFHESPSQHQRLPVAMVTELKQDHSMSKVQKAIAKFNIENESERVEDELQSAHLRKQSIDPEVTMRCRKSNTIDGSVNRRADSRQALRVKPIKSMADKSDEVMDSLFMDLTHQDVMACVIVKDTLWVGRRFSNDILIVSLSNNQELGYKYGQVISTLTVQQIPGYTFSHVDKMKLVSDRHVLISVVYVTCAREGTVAMMEVNLITLWEAWGAEKFHASNKMPNDLQECISNY